MFGERQAESIIGKEIQDWLTATAEKRGWSGATQNSIRAAMSTVFREGKRNNKITHNPARSTSRVKQAAGRIRFLTPTEEIRLSKEIPPVCIPQLDIALYTGMRKGKQFSVRWRQVDLDHRDVFLEDTKNGTSRHIHLNSTAMTVLTRMREEHDRLGLPDDTTIFVSQRHGTIANPRKWFETALAKAGIEGVTWHTLRHTFASRLVMAGVHLKTVQELMGHKSMAMTVRQDGCAGASRARFRGRLFRYKSDPKTDT